MCLLEQAAFALEEGARQRVSIRVAHRMAPQAARGHLHGAVPVVLDGLDLDLPATHGG